MKALVAGALLLGLSGCGWRDEELTKHQVEKYMKSAVILEEAGQLDEAIGEYQKILALVGTRDPWKTRVMEYRGIIKQLEEQKAETAQVTLQFERFKAIVALDDGSGAGRLLKEGRDFYLRVRNSGLPWLPELAAILEQLQARVDKK